MKISLVTGPSVEPITYEDFEYHARLSTTSGILDDETTYIESLITTARVHVEQILGRKLIYQTLDYYLDDWPSGDIVLPYSTLSGVDVIYYYDTDITQYTLDSDNYVVDSVSEPGRIVLKYGETWPTTQLHTSNPIKIRYSCGYGSAASDVPMPIKQSIKLMVTDMYETRQTEIYGVTVHVMTTIDRLLYPYRVWSGGVL